MRDAFAAFCLLTLSRDQVEVYQTSTQRIKVNGQVGRLPKFFLEKSFFSLPQIDTITLCIELKIKTIDIFCNRTERIAYFSTRINDNIRAESEHRELWRNLRVNRVSKDLVSTMWETLTIDKEKKIIARGNKVTVVNCTVFFIRTKNVKNKSA